MKKLLAVCCIVLSVMAAGAESASIATVDLASLIASHPKTEMNKKTLEELKVNAEARRDKKIDELKKLRDDVSKEIENAQNEALNDTARFAAREKAKSIAAQIQTDEAVLRDLVSGLQKELSSAEMKCLKETVDDIQAAVDAVAQESGIMLVLDASKNPVGGYSPVVYSAKALDITSAVAERLVSDVAAKAKE